MKRGVPLNQAKWLVEPGCVVLVTGGTMDKANVMTLSWQTPVQTADPCLVLLVMNRVRYTYELIRQNNELAINVPGEELLDQMGLRERLRHKPYQLSGGERQRVAIGRALMNQPQLLLADEPTGNLDSATGNGILNIFETLHQGGQTIVLVTHDERVARRAQRTITLVDGRIKA